MSNPVPTTRVTSPRNATVEHENSARFERNFGTTPRWRIGYRRRRARSRYDCIPVYPVQHRCEMR
eukprot:2959603-Prymnesium_polylepis.1